jgi:hypothetical protein
VRARSGPRHGLQPHAAVPAAQQPQLALDPAAAYAQIEVPPALDAAVMDVQPAGLGRKAEQTRRRRRSRAVTTTPSPVKLTTITDAPGQAEQPLECRGDAHVALLARPRSFEQPAACAPGGGASSAFRASSEELLKA